MSRVRRLGIRGIRNFGPGEEDNEIQTINFSHPLTLILGPNGTGKTTIIESLKYATTGEFPPGSSGGGKNNSFIHDPMLTKESAVRGLVKAEIVDVKGNSVTVSRRIECTQKKEKKVFQTLDTTLCRVDKDTGKKSAISHRCADVDAEMGLSLGVSKPILNYVIFCHQEDSTWPLDDAKRLKERFDQIFDSEKYNKALEKIRSSVKKLRTDVRVTRAEKVSLKILLEEANEKKKGLEAYENRLKQSIQKVTEIQARMEPIAQKMREFQETENQYIKLNSEKEAKKAEYGLLKQNMIELRNNIKVIHSGTMEELNKEMAAFDSIISKMETDMGILKEKLEEIIKEEKKLKDVVGEQQLSVGKLKQQALAQEKNIALRNKDLNEMLAQWGLEGIEEKITESEALISLDQLKKKLLETDTSIKDTAHEHQASECEMQKRLDDIRDQKTKLESGMIMLKKQMAEKRKEASVLRSQVNKTNTLASELEIIDSKLKDANTNVDSLTESLDCVKVKKNIEEEIKERDEMELSLEKVNKQVAVLQQQSSLHAELDLLKSNLMAKEKDIQKLRNKHEDNLKMLLKVESLPETGMKQVLNRVQESLGDKIRELNCEIQKQQRELTSLETTKKHTEDELKTKISELESIQDKITLMCHGKEYEDVVEVAKMTVEKLEQSRGMYVYKSVAYKEYIEKSESCCPLCHRNFDNRQELEEFRSELKEELDKNPNQLKIYEDQLISQKKRYNALLELRPHVDLAKRLGENTLEKLRNNLNTIKQKLSATHSRIEKLQLDIAEPESKLAQCKDIIGDVALWDQYSAEVTKLNQTITRVRGSLSDGAGEKSMREVQAEQESMRKSVTVRRKNIEQLQSKLSAHNNKLQSARESRNRLTEQRLRVAAEVQKLEQLENKLKDLLAEGITLEENVMELQKQLGPVNQQLESKDNLLQKTKKEHREILENQRSAFVEKSRRLNNLKNIQSEIDEYVRQGIAEKLRVSETDMKNYQNKIRELDAERTRVSTEIIEITNQISNQETRKRDMNDNKILKEKTAAAKILQNAVTQLREKLGDMNYMQLIEEKKKLKQEEEILIREQNVEQGGQDEIERNIRQLNKELKKDIYRFALKNYINKCAEIFVQDEAIEGLVAYMSALDKAIIEYHEERMISVNKIILNLWELIYKGKDTTAIQIQTEQTSRMGDKRRVYNYKVVQEKQKVTMDMRGRCSAGQKVLASIIIRMALAETFAKKCGIFALDEPTTNLDETNMNSLAQALATIVNIRSKHQKNFQLIVISHDEKFVHRLTKVNKIKKVYELFRNDIGLTEVKVWFIKDNGAMASGSKGEESSDEEADAETEMRSHKRKQLVEERKNLLQTNLAISPPRKKRVTKTDD